jgi:hypothetical protein
MDRADTSNRGGLRGPDRCRGAVSRGNGGFYNDFGYLSAHIRMVIGMTHDGGLFHMLDRKAEAVTSVNAST